MQELSHKWMLHSSSLMLKRGNDNFFFAILDISPLQQAQPSNVLREVKTSLSFLCEFMKGIAPRGVVQELTR